MNALASRLMILRGLAGGMSQRELARLADLSPSYPGIIERAPKEPEVSGHIATRLAGVFGCTISYLLNGVGSPPAESAVRAAVAKARETVEAEAAADKAAS